MDGGELDAKNGRIFVAGEAAVVVERERDGLARGERLLEAQPQGGILLVAGSGNLLAFFIHHARHVERVVQFEGGRGDAVAHGQETHAGLGCQRRGVRRDFRLDGVLLDIDAGGGAVLLGRRGRSSH